MAWNRFQGRANKYKAIKVFKYGRNWPSKMELGVYEWLLLAERAGLCRDIELQVSVRFWTYDHGRIWIIPDFRVTDTGLFEGTGEKVFVEAKSNHYPDAFKRKRRAWLAGGPGKMYIMSGRYQKPKLKEVLVPKAPAQGDKPDPK